MYRSGSSVGHMAPLSTLQTVERIGAIRYGAGDTVLSEKMPAVTTTLFALGNFVPTGKIPVDIKAQHVQPKACPSSHVLRTLVQQNHT